MNQFKCYLFDFIGKQMHMKQGPYFLLRYILHNIIPVWYYARNCCYLSLEDSPDFTGFFVFVDLQKSKHFQSLCQLSSENKYMAMEM